MIRRWLDNLDTFLAIFAVAHFEQPLVSLHLWINHEAPPVGILPDNCILSRKVVLRKAIAGPLCNFDLISEDRNNIKVVCARDAEHLEHVDPLVCANGAIGGNKHT